jgi:hypothetical protein
MPGMSCLAELGGAIDLGGGIDTFTAQLMLQHLCGASSAPAPFVGDCPLSEAAAPKHFHEHLARCLSAPDASSGHSSRIGTAGDGRGVYGMYEAHASQPALDVCGAHVGPTPDSNGELLVHYHAQLHPPFFVGCYTNADATMSVDECRALFPGCASASRTVSTAHGVGAYQADCPCWDPATRSNVPGETGRPAFWPSTLGPPPASAGAPSHAPASPRAAPAGGCAWSEHGWLQHCAVSADCTSEDSFCGCCATHRATVYAAACVRCPKVDEDIDLWGCIYPCMANRMNASLACYSGCNSSCTAQASVEQEACDSRCSLPDTTLPSGDTVGGCTASATAHPVAPTAAGLTGGRHDDLPCLRGCAESPPSAVLNCVGACPQNATDCVALCLKNRARIGEDCIYPRLVSECNHTSVAQGEGADGVGYAALRNTLAVKFDTWYNAENLDPWNNHIAVHSGGYDHGAPTDTSQALGVSYGFADMADGEYHQATVEYSPTWELSAEELARAATRKSIDPAVSERLTPAAAAHLTTAQRGNMRYVGALSVAIDGVHVLRVPLNLEDLLKLDPADGGSAYVGFTGATGKAYQEHSIAQWTFRSFEGESVAPANLHCRQRVPVHQPKRSAAKPDSGQCAVHGRPGRPDGRDTARSDVGPAGDAALQLQHYHSRLPRVGARQRRRLLPRSPRRGRLRPQRQLQRRRDLFRPRGQRGARCRGAHRRAHAAHAARGESGRRALHRRPGQRRGEHHTEPRAAGAPLPGGRRAAQLRGGARRAAERIEQPLGAEAAPGRTGGMTGGELSLGAGPWCELVGAFLGFRNCR